MAVWVDKAVRIHEAVIFRLVVGRAACGDRFGDKTIYLLTALATEGEQNLDGLARIADGFGREVTKPGVRKQHNRNRVADGDARASIVGGMRVVRVAECLEKGHCLREVGDREVDDYLCADFSFVLLVVMMCGAA
jgi:hypothetical protein